MSTRASIPLPIREHAGRGFTLATGLTGELRAYRLDQNKQICESVLVPTPDGPGRTWSPERRLPNGRVRHSAAFAHVYGPSKTSRLGNHTTIASDLYSVVIYSDKDSRELCVQVKCDGTIQIVRVPGTLEPARANAKPLALQGVFDAPAPVPQMNLLSISRGGSVTPEMVGRPMSTVEYGKSQDSEQVHKVVSRTTLGYKSSISVKLGLGSTWEQNLRMGTGRVDEQVQSVLKEEAVTGETWLSVSEGGTGPIEPAAEALLLGSYLSFMEQQYLFLNPDGQRMDQATPPYPTLAVYAPVRGAEGGGTTTGGGSFEPFTVAGKLRYETVSGVITDIEEPTEEIPYYLLTFTSEEHGGLPTRYAVSARATYARANTGEEPDPASIDIGKNTPASTWPRGMRSEARLRRGSRPSWSSEATPSRSSSR